MGEFSWEVQQSAARIRKTCTEVKTDWKVQLLLAAAPGKIVKGPREIEWVRKDNENEARYCDDSPGNNWKIGVTTKVKIKQDHAADNRAAEFHVRCCGMLTRSKLTKHECPEEWTIFNQRRVRIVGVVFYTPRNALARPTLNLYAVNKFLLAGKPTGSDWGRSPQGLNPAIERRVLDRACIAELMELFQSQPWVTSPQPTQWQAEAEAAAKFAVQHAERTSFHVEVDGREVLNYLAVGPGRSILVCWNGTWRGRDGVAHEEIMFQAVVPLIGGLSSYEMLRSFLGKFAMTDRRIMLDDWKANDSRKFRQACKAFWNVFPDLSTNVSRPEEIVCTLCLEDLDKSQCQPLTRDLNAGVAGWRTDCGHFFHADCLNQWFDRYDWGECPVCKRNPTGERASTRGASDRPARQSER